MVQGPVSHAPIRTCLASNPTVLCSDTDLAKSQIYTTQYYVCTMDRSHFVQYKTRYPRAKSLEKFAVLPRLNAIIDTAVNGQAFV